VVFDTDGGSDDGLAVFVGGERKPAPPDIQKNEAVQALVRGLAEAQNAASEAQRQWDAVARDRTATPEQLRQADLALTQVTNRLQQLRYEQKQATSLFGLSAPAKQ